MRKLMETKKTPQIALRSLKLWDMVDSNHRLLPCQGSALNQLS